ncbi:hypothetical protein [Thalassoglobus sp.]|uniref:phage major capsid protein n=1 Tax=Thalassoglobus sp. TaxID=2795869 RepID=UPI003AA9C538
MPKTNPKTATPSQLPDPLRVPANLRIIEGEGPTDFRFLEAAADENAGDNAEKELRRFSMTAYTGGKLLLAGFAFPVIVDLSGLKVSAKSRPILRDHDASRIVGHTETLEVNAGSIKLAGVISGANDHAREVTASGDNGFPWQSSIGAIAQRIVFVDQGESVEVNGRKFSGPVYVARQSTLREVSFVALGADDQTIAQLIARHSQPSSSQIEAQPMEFEAWVEAQGFDPNALTDQQSQSLRAMWSQSSNQADTESNDNATSPASNGTNADEAQVSASAATETATAQLPPNLAGQLRAQWVAEHRRIMKITEICAGEFPEIQTQAVEEGWDATQTELAVLRASRPKAPPIHASRGVASARVLEAAVWLSAKIPEQECLRKFGEQTLDAADPIRAIKLRELVAECARLEGHDVPRVFGEGRATIDAGFATVSLPGILESVMNRTMLAAYEATPIAALQLCAIGSVSDFKEVTRYRLLGTGGFEKVSPSGELKAGALSEQAFKNRAETFGQYLMLTRNDIINDDLEAFLELPKQMGRSGAESIDDLFFSLFLSNPDNFFSGPNNNYLAGASTAFGPDSLTVAKTQFRKQKAGPGGKAKNQKPINVRPKYLVVPVEIETDAELLMGSAQLMIDASGTATKIPVDNPHRNKYEVVSMPHLSDAVYSGASAKAWYLFADPALVPAFEIVFLNGRRTPVIERVDAAPNSLGMGFRSYIDFGVREQDPRGAVKVKGEA